MGYGGHAGEAGMSHLPVWPADGRDRRETMRVLMVEDEELTRNGIYRCIPWESLGIGEVYMAEDG